MTQLLRWSGVLLVALIVGILLGLPSGIDRGQIATRSEIVPAQGFPVVAFGDVDYHTDNGIVRTFVNWGHDALATRAESIYPPAAISPAVQRALFTTLVATAGRLRELPTVISGSALNAIALANRDELAVIRRAGGSPTGKASTAIIYAERAQYFGQDVWCFLCLTTADHQHGSVRVLVMSCVPAYGLVHLQRVGSY
jgi:hypothetical protein